MKMPKFRTQNKYLGWRKRNSFNLIEQEMTGKDAIEQKQCDSPTRLKLATAKKFDLLDINLEELQGNDSSNDSAIVDQDHLMIVQLKVTLSIH